MNTLWYKFDQRPLYKKQQKIIDIWHSMDNLQQKRKHRKWIRKDPLEKDLTFFFCWMITSKHSFNHN